MNIKQLLIFVIVSLLSACSLGGKLIIMDEKKEQTNSFYNYFSVSVDTGLTKHDKIDLIFYDVFADASIFDLISPTWQYKIGIRPDSSKVEKCILVKIEPRSFVFGGYTLFSGNYQSEINIEKEQYFPLEPGGKEYSNIVYAGKLSLNSETKGFKVDSSGKEKCDLELSKQYTQIDFTKSTNAAALREKRENEKAKKK